MKEKRSKLGLGIALLVLGVILLSGKFQSDSALDQYTLASEPIEVRGFSSGQSEDLVFPNRIVIPALSIDLEVKRAKIIDGFWEVFPDTAAWGSSSGLPGEKGNQVIFAHAREGLFLPLKGVVKGMKIYVTTKDKWYSYEVKEIKEVTPDRIEVIAPTDTETLTLYTCSGFQDSKRLIVVAKTE